MWSISGSECVKRAVFCILKDYPRTDVDALISSNKYIKSLIFYKQVTKYKRNNLASLIKL